MKVGGGRGLEKNPGGTNPFIVVLVVVVLVAAVEILIPGVVVIVLRRTPVVVGPKTSNRFTQRCGDAPQRVLRAYVFTEGNPNRTSVPLPLFFQALLALSGHNRKDSGQLSVGISPTGNLFSYPFH